MKVKDYVQKYNLQGKENIQFDNNSLLEDLNKDFIGLIQAQGERITYPIFHNLVKQINIKFWAISNKRWGTAFTFEYWNAFFALYIIPKRKELFPELHAQMEADRSSKTEYQ